MRKTETHSFAGKVQDPLELVPITHQYTNIIYRTCRTNFAPVLFGTWVFD